MKAAGHPTYFDDAKVVCACGNTFLTGSTQQEIRVELCAQCHPFYTGTQKLVDTQGQVEKFTQRTANAATKKVERAKIVEQRQARVQQDRGDKPTLKDLLMQARKKAA